MYSEANIAYNKIDSETGDLSVQMQWYKVSVFRANIAYDKIDSETGDLSVWMQWYKVSVF